jgi:hypothetical protein
MGGIGMAIVGLVTSPMMGKIMDEHMVLDSGKTMSALQSVSATFPQLQATAKGRTGEDIAAALRAANEVIVEKATTGTLPDMKTANALRSAIAAAPNSEAAQEAKAVLGPAENQGGQVAFRYVAPLSIILAIIFGILYFRDRAQGGYKVERLPVTGAAAPAEPKLEKTTS